VELMRLRSFIEGQPGSGLNPQAPATVATVATGAASGPSTVARIATVASPGEPDLWLVKLRAGGLEGLSLSRWVEAAGALEAILQTGVVEEALQLGWDVREIIGVQMKAPHDHPSRAGLIFSLKPGDEVRGVRSGGCVIAYDKIRHIWRRVPLPQDRSIVLPWELPAKAGLS
jgi:hypothetical protein